MDMLALYLMVNLMPYFVGKETDVEVLWDS
jgi:hypothetical protein